MLTKFLSKTTLHLLMNRIYHNIHYLILLFRLMYETDSFFETIAEKNYGEVNNFSVSPWYKVMEIEAESRTMHYEYPQAFAFSKVVE